MTGQHAAKIPDFGDFLRGLPWVIAILVFSFIFWLVYQKFFLLFMNEGQAQYAALAMGPQVALQITLFALADNWPFQKVENRWARGVYLTLLAIVVQAVFWITAGLTLDLETWAFPIIATSWFFIALTSFVGGDAHMPDVPPARRTLINTLIMVAGTILILKTIVWIPPFWFGMLEIVLVTGGAAYYFRRIRQPIFSVATWALLILLMWIMLQIAAYFGQWSLVTSPATDWSWMWSIGAPIGVFGVWFALTGGFNFSVLSLIHGWPFSRIKQPWATPVAIITYFPFLILVAYGLMAVVKLIFPAQDVIWQSTILAWQTVAWGWAWVYCFQACSEPFLWAGQKTPGTWDDVD